MKSRIKECLRLGRLFNAEIMGLILIVSYILTTELHNAKIEFEILFGLFFAGILAHVWGCYNNDRLDLVIDKNTKYCTHKPLVSGSISIQTALIIEVMTLIVFVMITIWISPKLSTAVYLSGAVSIAYLYNRFNKSNMFTNVAGQIYASFVVLIGMSVVVDFDIIIFLSAVVIGLNAIYLNIIEGDLKDVKGDIVNVPKAFGLDFYENKAVNIKKFYILNETLKLSMFAIILIILYLEQVNSIIIFVAFSIFLINYLVRRSMFNNLSLDREKMKSYFAAQELTSILLISTIYIIVHPLLPLFLIIFVIIWLIIWNKYLWGTYFRPQV